MRIHKRLIDADAAAARSLKHDDTTARRHDRFHDRRAVALSWSAEGDERFSGQAMA